MIPMCWKCVSNEHEPDVTGRSVQLVGCKENPEIKDYEDALKKCPLIQKDKLTKPESGV